MTCPHSRWHIWKVANKRKRNQYRYFIEKKNFMASAWSTYHQTTQSAQRSLHSQLPQRRLQYWSCPGVQRHRTKKTRPFRHKHCKHFWLSVSANSSARYRKPSRPPRVRMPPPGGTSWGRPSTLRPCRLSAEWTGLVTAGSTPAYRSWSPLLSSNSKPTWNTKRTHVRKCWQHSPLHAV